MGKIDICESEECGDAGMAVTDSSAFLTSMNSSLGDDNNANEVTTVSLVFLPPEPSKNPYESYKMVEEVQKDESSGNRKVDGKCSCENYMGIIYTLGAGFIFTIGGIIVKYMKDYHPISLAVYRFQGVLLPALALALYSHYVKKEEVFSTIWPWTDKEKRKKFIFTSIRGILGGLAMIFLFYSIQYTTLADSLVIHSCRPVFVTFIAYIFLSEPCGVFPVFAALLTVVGVGVISRPPMITGQESFDEDTLKGTGFAVAAMLTTAVSMVVLRYVRGVHVSLVTLLFGTWGTIVSVIGCVIVNRFDVPATMEHILLALCLATVTFFAQVLITMAMRYEQAGAVAIVRSFDTIFAFILQFLILGTIPDFYSLLGAALVIFCVLLIAFRKWISTLPEKHTARQRYWFVLK